VRVFLQYVNQIGQNKTRMYDQRNSLDASPLVTRVPEQFEPI
jgi:hypothetical protein